MPSLAGRKKTSGLLEGRALVLCGRRRWPWLSQSQFPEITPPPVPAVSASSARRTKSEDTSEEPVKRGLFYWLGRLAPATLTARIIIINFIGLAILSAGISYSSHSRDSLIGAQVESLLTQGRIMAAAVASSATIDTGQIVIDPLKLLEEADKTDPPLDLDQLLRRAELAWLDSL